MLEDWEAAEATEQKGKPRVFEGLIWFQYLLVSTSSISSACRAHILLYQ